MRDAPRAMLRIYLGCVHCCGGWSDSAICLYMVSFLPVPQEYIVLVLAFHSGPCVGTLALSLTALLRGDHLTSELGACLCRLAALLRAASELDFLPDADSLGALRVLVAAVQWRAPARAAISAARAAASAVAAGATTLPHDAPSFGAIDALVTSHAKLPPAAAERTPELAPLVTLHGRAERWVTSARAAFGRRRGLRADGDRADRRVTVAEARKIVGVGAACVWTMLSCEARPETNVAVQGGVAELCIFLVGFFSRSVAWVSAMV